LVSERRDGKHLWCFDRRDSADADFRIPFRRLREPTPGDDRCSRIVCGHSASQLSPGLLLRDDNARGS
jgi:hypothetical protein